MEKQFIILILTILFNCIAEAQTIIVNPDGTHSIVTTTNGNNSIVVNSDGTHSILINNGSTSTLVNPDGTHSILVNNGNISTIVNLNGTHSTMINNASTSTIVNPDSINMSVATTFVYIETDSIKNNSSDTIKNVVPVDLKTVKKKSE